MQNHCRGKKRRDWIEYKITTSGTPPEEFNLKWAKMEILEVRDATINVKTTKEYLNGSVSCSFMTLNIQKGKIGA